MNENEDTTHKYMGFNDVDSKRQVHITKLFQKSGGWWEISYNELKIIPKNK